MERIRYSIITPHKNCPSLLNRLLKSIPQRDDVEVIIIDDNSDPSQKPQIENDSIKVVYLDEGESRGAGHARNVGLIHARGEWLLFPDSDDFYVDGFLEKLDEYINSNLDILYFSFKYIDGKTGEELPLELKRFYDEFDGTELSADKIKFLNIPPWTKMVSASFVQEHKIQFEEVINGNDMFFSFRAGYCAKYIAVIKDALYCYVKNEKGLSNNKSIPVKAHLCRIEHVMQLRSFYSFIKHPEWRPSLTMRIIRSLKQGGVKMLLPLISSFPSMLKHSRDLVKLVNNN